MLAQLKNWWNGLWEPLRPPETGCVHDYTVSRHGHSLGLISDDCAAVGWGCGVRVGDIVLAKLQSGRVGRMLVLDVRYERDPQDMWFATLERVGYTNEKNGTDEKNGDEK